MTVIEASRLIETEPDFQKRVRHFLVKVAIAVMGEDGATTHHDRRLILARSILNAPDGFVYRFGLGCMTNATLLAATDQRAISDADLEFTVNSLFNAYLAA